MADGGHIYVDLDDVLSHTIELLVELLEERFDRRVPVVRPWIPRRILLSCPSRS